jgi:hypothetical protein
MNRKELVVLSIGIFLTMLAIVFNSLYHIQNEKYINREIPPVSVPHVNIDTQIFTQLKEKK